MRSKQATRRAFSPPARCALVAWPPSRKASFAQQTFDILRLVEILGGIESDRLNQPRRGEVRPIEIGAVKRDAGSVAPPKVAPRSEALVRSAFWSDANSRSTRDRSASRRIAR